MLACVHITHIEVITCMGVFEEQRLEIINVSTLPVEVLTCKIRTLLLMAPVITLYINGVLLN